MFYITSERLIKSNSGISIEVYLMYSNTRVRSMSELCQYLIKGHPDLIDTKRADLTWEMVIIQSITPISMLG